MNKIIEELLGENGSMITFSKSNYRRENPNNIIVFNSNIIINDSKYWYGDIDVSKDKDKLIYLSMELNETIYILYEMDCRFDTEDKPKIDNYVIKFSPDGTYKLHKRLVDYYKI